MTDMDYCPFCTCVRYLTTIMNIVQFINEDLGPPGQGVVDVFFQEK